MSRCQVLDVLFYSFTKIYLFDRKYVPIYSYMYILYLWYDSPPPQIPTYFLYVVYMTTSVKFFMNLWHIFLTFYDKITPVNLCIHDTCHKDSIVQIYLHEVKNWSCSILEKKKKSLLVQCTYLHTFPFAWYKIKTSRIWRIENFKDVGSGLKKF